MDSDSEPKEQTPTYHPSYASSDADLVLASSDGRLFKVHSPILRLSSVVFRDMFSLPRNGDPADEPIPLSERAIVLKGLLDVLYPGKFVESPWPYSYEDFLDLCVVLTHKYDVENGEKLASSLFHDDRLPFSPILRYGLARRFGWHMEAKNAKVATLTRGLFLEDTFRELRKLDSDASLDLIEFHEERKRKVLDIFEPGPWQAGSWGLTFYGHQHSPKCWKHEKGLMDAPVWLALRDCLRVEIERQPTGYGLENLNFIPERIEDELFEIDVYCDVCCPNLQRFKLTLSGLQTGMRRLSDYLNSDLEDV
jgi:hypothetical protein